MLLLWMGIFAGCAQAPDPSSQSDRFTRFDLSPNRLVIIDDDVGMDRSAVRVEGNYNVSPWFKHTDPDGGLEILYAAREVGVDLLGVTCAAGTVSQAMCMVAARRVLDVGGHQDIPVLRGAVGSEERGQSTAASRFMCAALHRFPGRVEIIASAPLTNISTLLSECPAAPMLWKRLAVLSGEFGRGSDIEEFSGLTGGDLNLSVDFPAAQHVFANAGPFEIYPNELMDDVLFTWDDLRFLAERETPLALFLYDELVEWATLFGLTNDFAGFYPHGMIGIAPVLDPYYAGAVSEGVGVTVIAEGLPVGRHYWGAVRNAFTADGPHHKIVWSLNDEGRFRREFRLRLQ